MNGMVLDLYCNNLNNAQMGTAINSMNEKPKNVYLHADDFGLSRGITDSILKAVDHGGLNSVSLVPNGYAFDHAVEELRKRPDIRLVIHLNLHEGLPVDQKGGLGLICDEKGYFNCSFLKLWGMWMFRSKAERQELKAEVRGEVRSQIKKIADHFKEGYPLNIDSHQHFHVIPFVFDILMELKDEFNIAQIRIPKEPLFFHINSLQSLRNYLGLNLVKHFLLNQLSRVCLKKIKGEDISFNKYMIGVLFTGNMTFGSIKKALRNIDLCDEEGFIEIVFHPGVPLEKEKNLWSDRPYNARYYCSPSRLLEWQEVMRYSVADYQQLIKKNGQQ